MGGVPIEQLKNRIFPEHLVRLAIERIFLTTFIGADIVEPGEALRFGVVRIINPG